MRSVDGLGFTVRFNIPTNWHNENERDACVGAVYAREGFEGRWPTDLAVHRQPSEQDPKNYWLAPMRYFGPQPL